MKIGIDATAAAKINKTGVEHLVSELILELSKLDKKNQYFLYANDEIKIKNLTNKNFHAVIQPAKFLWNKITLPKLIKKTRPDVFIEPSYMLPPNSPKNSIVFVYDLAHKYFPKAYTYRQRIILDQSMRTARKSASDIVFISENSKRDFNRFYPGSKSRQHVIYPGFGTKKDPISKNQLFNLPKKYLLFVGRLEERKNVLNIIRAYKLLRLNSTFNHKLLLVGKHGFGFDKIESEIKKSGFDADIIISGYMSDNFLDLAYHNASVFIFPSFYEGFGIPVLEAFSHNVPVVCSNTSSFPEFVNEAALKVNPKNPAEIEKAVETLLSNTKLKAGLVKKGKAISLKYSYKNMASNLFEVIKSFEK